MLPTDAGIQEIYGALATDERRTELIVKDTLRLVAEGRSPIILTERREHLERLAEGLRGRVAALVELHGDVHATAPRSRSSPADRRGRRTGGARYRPLHRRGLR